MKKEQSKTTLVLAALIPAIVFQIAGVVSFETALNLLSPANTTGLLLFILILVCLVAASGVWLSLLLDCWRRDDFVLKRKVIWSIVILFGSFSGALAYFLLHKPNQIAAYLRREEHLDSSH